ncbi:Verru-Chthon cassette protein D [Tepidimonas alkaliphilus]|uniref:Type II secretion system protein H n=1 Tax=Tepidimonas alkaliphilus TaxID=2588942 RepID=A0A554W4S0_9BURK|nr:GspH/FimT family pseudopilin [Tepidimonas alkaliphilus]TSE18553.1 Verru-Chthon cassette protein D [Tepidimonas alkaliphilus]
MKLRMQNAGQPPRAARLCAAHTGVTLIEALVVVAILAILATLAAPNLRDFITHHRIQTTAEGMRSALAYAKFEAIRRNQSVYFCVTPPNGSSAGKWEIKTPSSPLNPLQFTALRQGTWSSSLTVEINSQRTQASPDGIANERCVQFLANSLPRPEPSSAKVLIVKAGDRSCGIDVQNTIIQLDNPCPQKQP